MKKHKVWGCLLLLLMLAAGLHAQEPAAFTSEEVLFSGTDTLHYGGTLTLPQGKKPMAAVVILSGTNPQNRDGEMAGHKVFKEIAECLSARGIAVLRVDDRGVGATNGDYSRATTFDFATDALAAVAYLKTRKEIDPRTIGLLGHSEGAAAASIAASRSRDVAFLISAAGLMSDGLSSVIQQNIDIVHAAPIPDYDKARYDEINGIMFPIAYRYADADSLVLANRLQEAYDKWVPRSDSIFKSQHAGEYDHFRFPIYMYICQATTPWYRFFIRYNPADYLSHVDIPVLAVNGTKDIMVHCEQNLENVRRYLAHNKDVTTVPIEGVNHLLLPCEKGTQEEYAQIKAPVSPRVLDVISQWIEQHVRPFRIEGTLPDASYDHRTIRLVEHDLFDYDNTVVIDSAQVEQGRFVLQGTLCRPVEVASLELVGTRSTDLFCVLEQTLFLEPGTIQIAYDSLGVTLSGTPINEQYNELLLRENRRIRQQTERITAERDRKEAKAPLSVEEQEEYNRRLRNLYLPYREQHNRFVRANIGNAAGAAFYFRFPPESYPEADRAYLLEQVDPLLLRAYREKEEKKQQEERYFSNSQKQMSEGHRYREVEGMDPEGNPVRLSDYVKPGRVVLIDFWASWCGPCVMEIPFFKELYRKHHAAGLDIVSISLDTNKAAWLRALEKHRMEWPQLSDLQGWKGRAPKDYGISAIPFVLLLDKQGNIIVRNLHDHLLERAIEEALK